MHTNGPPPSFQDKSPPYQITLTSSTSRFLTLTEKDDHRLFTHLKLSKEKEQTKYSAFILQIQPFFGLSSQAQPPLKTAALAAFLIFVAWLSAQLTQMQSGHIRGHIHLYRHLYNPAMREHRIPRRQSWERLTQQLEKLIFSAETVGKTCVCMCMCLKDFFFYTSLITILAESLQVWKIMVLYWCPSMPDQYSGECLHQTTPQ